MTVDWHREADVVMSVDSLSHAWFWELNETSRAENSFRAWSSVRPLERALIDARSAIDQAEFDGCTSPSQLSSDNCDHLVARLEGLRESA